MLGNLGTQPRCQLASVDTTETPYTELRAPLAQKFEIWNYEVSASQQCCVRSLTQELYFNKVKENYSS